MELVDTSDLKSEDLISREGSTPSDPTWVAARYEKHFRHLASDYGCEKSELPLPVLFGMRIGER